MIQDQPDNDDQFKGRGTVVGQLVRRAKSNDGKACEKELNARFYDEMIVV